MKKDWKKRKLHKSGLRSSALALAALVVFVTVYALILPALTLEKAEAETEAGIVLLQEDRAADNQEEPAEAASIEPAGAEAFAQKDAPKEEAAAKETPAAKEDAKPGGEPLENTAQKANKPETEEVCKAESTTTAVAGPADQMEPKTSAEEPAVREQETGPQAVSAGEQLNTQANAGEVKNTEADAGAQESEFPTQAFEAVLEKAGATIRVEAGEGAFPAGTSMKAEDVSNEKDVKETVAESVDGQIMSLQAFDISFYNKEGKKIEPAKAIKVTVVSDRFDQKADPEILHIPDAGGTAEHIEQIDVHDPEIATADDEVVFETDHFSIYAFVYTVDFHWAVNGKLYDFSIPGGGFVSFTDLVEMLGIAKEDKSGDFDGEVSEDTRRFVADVKSITFSTPSLLSVSKVEESTTVGVFKDGLGLECQYSAELTEEQIAEINAQTVEAGDWALISVQPFTSEETLTVTMTNGDSFEIRVTDAQISTYVLTDQNDLYKVTLTYDDRAAFPDHAELKVCQITEDEKQYDKLRRATDQALFDKYEEGLAKEENLVTLDIGVYANGVEVEPADDAAVQLEIWLAASLLEEETEEDAELTEDIHGLWCNGKILAPDHTAPVVVHHLDDGATEVIDEIKSNRDENGETIAFETSSFSAYSIPTNGNTGTNLYLSKNYSGNTPLYVGDEIYYKGTDIEITDGKDTVAALFDKNGDYKAVRLVGTGSFTLKYKDGNQMKQITRTVEPYPTYDTSSLPVISTVTNEEAGISLDLFDYDLDGILNHSWNGDNAASRAWYTGQGINKDHSLKFWTQCPGYDTLCNNGWSYDADQTTYGKNGNFVTRNIVADRLGSDKYPYISGTSESLNYLFDPDEQTADRKVYRNADKLFKYEDGYYIYDSTANYAYFNPAQGDNGQFIVYGKTYQYNNQDLKQNGTPIGFFPFHPYNETYERDLTTISAHQQMNHHFGLSMSAKFAIPIGGQDNYGHPIKYQFSGDDDMWVFIDDDLALDIGGIHQPIYGEIDFSDIDHGKAVVKVFPLNNVKNKDTPLYTKEITGLKANKSYTLRAFYLERGGGDSNCKIVFNLPTYRTLKLAKRLNGLSENEYAKYTEEWFTYELNLNGGLYNTPDEAKYMAANPEYDLRPLVRDANGNIIGAELDANDKPVYDAYGNLRTVNLGKTETAANRKQARWMVVTDGQIHIKDGWVVEIPHLSRSDNFYVAEEKTINMDEFEAPHAEREYFTNTDGAHHEEEVDLKAATSEGENPDEHKHLQDWKTQRYTLEETEKVTFTNTLKEKNLIVKKKWSDGNENHADDSITFQVIAKIKQGNTEGLYSQLHAQEHNIWGKVTGKFTDSGVKENPSEEPILQHVYTLSSANDWEMMFEHLPAVTEDDEVITYSVIEKSGKDGYVSGEPVVTEKRNVDVFKYFPDNSYLDEDETIGFYLTKDGKYYTGKAEPNAWSDTTEGAEEYTLKKSKIRDESYHCRFYDMPAGEYGVEPVAADDSNPLTKGLAIHTRPVKEFEIPNVKKEKGEITIGKQWLGEDGNALATPPASIFYDIYQLKHVHSWTATGNKEDATDETEGREEYTCTCGETRNVTLPRTDHVHDMEYVAAVDATCTTAGNVAYWHCKKQNDDQNYKDQDGTTVLAEVVIPAQGHDFSQEVSNTATCDQAGMATWKCSRCAQTEQRSVPAKSHDWGSWTASGNGTETRICKNDPAHKETRQTYKLYKDTRIILQDYTWPTQKTTLTPGGIFEYGGNYWVIVEQKDLTEGQLSGGPGGNAYAWNTVIKVAGNFYTSKTFTEGSAYQNGQRQDMKEGDIYLDDNGDYYLFKNGKNSRNGKTPKDEPNNWYLIPRSTYAASEAEADTAVKKLQRQRAAGAKKTFSANMTEEQLRDYVGVTALGEAGSKDGNTLTKVNASPYELETKGTGPWTATYQYEIQDDENTVYTYYVLETEPSSGWITTYEGQDNGLKNHDQVTIINRKKPDIKNTPTSLTVQKRWLASDGKTDVSEKYVDKTIKFDVYQVSVETTQAQSGSIEETQQMLIAVYDKDRTAKYLSDELGHLGNQFQYVTLPVGAEITATFTPKDPSESVTANYLDHISASGVDATRGNSGNVVTLKFTVDKQHSYAYLMNDNLSFSKFDISISIGTTTVSQPVKYLENVELVKGDDNSWTWSRSDLPGTKTEGRTTTVYKYYIKEVDNGGTDTVVSGLSEVPVTGGEIVIKNIEKPTKPTPQNPKDPEPVIRKYVEKVSGEVSNDDYNLTLTVKSDSEVPSSKLDVLFVVDTTYSMTYKQLDNGQKSSWDGIKDALGYLIQKFDASDVDVEYAMTRFWSYQSNYPTTDDPYQDSTVVKGWTAKAKDITDSLSSLELKNATNYDAAFYTLQQSGLLTRTGERATTPKLVIFISDGYPNIYYDSNGYDVADDHYVGGRYPDSENAAFARLSQVSGMNGFYALGVSNSVGKEVLDTLVTYANAEHRGAFQCNDTGALQNAFDSILDTYAGSNLKKVRIEDTLSDYAQPAGTGTSSDAAVTITVQNAAGTTVGKATGTIAEPVTLVLDKTQRNDSNTLADRTLTAVYDSTAKKLKLQFPDGYELENHWDYQVTMAIEPTLKAYEEYRSTGYPDGMKGDPNTDVEAGAEVTSSNKPGFKSNKEAKLYYNDKDPILYPDPVIQTLLTEIQLLKIDGSSKAPLQNVTFHLYRKAEADDSKPAGQGGVGATIKEIEVPSGTTTSKVNVVEVSKDMKTDANGHIVFGKLIPGTYYLEEATPPENYTGIGTMAFTITVGDYDANVPGSWRLLIPTSGSYPGCTWQWDDTNTRYTLTVPNTRTGGYALPSAGGPGTAVFYILGAGLALSAGIALVARRKNAA